MRVNSYSLVAYAEGEFGEFLNALRQELVPGCVARAHLTILPPRPLELHPHHAAEYLDDLLSDTAAFSVEVPAVRVFEQTAVIFADISCGRNRLIQLHQQLATGPLAYDEPYPYHPHITLAQNIGVEAVPALFEVARQRWQGPRRFHVDRLTFVQNTDLNHWLDLHEWTLTKPLDSH